VGSLQERDTAASGGETGQGIAKRRLSDHRVLLELMELGIEASKQKEQAFFELAGAVPRLRRPGRGQATGRQAGADGVC
jgi:hypothetical protein